MKMYSPEEILNIIYNNRSLNGVTKNFLPNLNILKLLKLERLIEEVDKDSINKDRSIVINKEDLDLEEDDILVKEDDIKYASKFLFDAIGKFTPEEKQYLNKRCITDSIIEKYKIGSFSFIQDQKALDALNITTHPILKRVLGDGVKGGGIFVPLIINGKLINSINRRLVDINKIKYSVAIPNVNLWGLNELKEKEELWLVEGIFDMIAILENGRKSITGSAVSLSSIQIIQILDKNPDKINILFDNDEAGLINSLKLKQIFQKYNIPVSTWISTIAKDPAEHFLEKGGKWNQIKEIEITPELILDSNGDGKFKEVEMNFLNYMKSRKF